jgi:hypothetical protein
MVTARRTKRVFTHCMLELVAVHELEKICIVLNNLSTLGRRRDRLRGVPRL